MIAGAFLFYFRTHFDDVANAGVINKCKAIASGCPHRKDLLFFTQKGLHLNDETLPALAFSAPKRSLAHYRLYYFKSDRWVAQNIDFGAYHTFYIRHLPAHAGFVRLLEHAKQQNPALRILVELPTWPYDAEQPRSLLGKMAARIDRYYRQKMAHYVDAFVHYGRETTVLSRPTIRVDNGIDLSPIPLLQPTFATDTLRVIAVGHWSIWHGLDRLLAGMAKYDQYPTTPTIQLTIVGEGHELGRLKAFVDAHHLQPYVRFHPACQGDSLHELFRQANIAVGSLGIHRIGLAHFSALKHREYCGRGIPFIMAGIDPDFGHKWPFTLVIPSDETPVCIEDLFDFIQSVRQKYPDYPAQMRQFAEENLTWERKMRVLYG